MTDSMITVDYLTKRFGKYTAVDRLSFTIPTHRALALWGPNGAGKTTVIKCILGLLGYQGRIAINGVDQAGQGAAVRRQLGYVPQELAFYDDLSVRATAHFFARLRKVDTREVDPALARVGLDIHATKPVRTLSGGLKQRLALAIALLGDPPVLILDEPTANLDAQSRSQFLALLAQLKLFGKTILFTSHRLDEVEALADDVLVMERGQARFTCAADELSARLGLSTQIKLHMPPAQIGEALDVLTAGGFEARRNGTGVLVQVVPDAKAAPIHLLSRANIHVIDFAGE
jgi:ABC-type multidrug transport system ATPase subunit